MKSLYGKIVLFVLLVGLLSSCGAQPAATPASPAADTSVPATEVPTDVPPPTEAAAPTEPPAATEDPVTQPAASQATVSFANDILPIFESRCMGCHGRERTQEGLDLKTYASLMSGSNNGPVVTPGDPADSLLVELVTNQKMPKRGPKLTPPQLQLITDWVNQGALEN